MNILQNYFMIDGVSSLAYGIWINGDGRWGGAEPDVEVVSVPGRSGELTLSNDRWHNRELYYRCFILKNFISNFESFRAMLLAKAGYRRIEDTYKPTEYVMGRVTGGLDISSIEWVNDTGSFTVRFSCMPQRFLTSGETEQNIMTDATVTNPTQFYSKPIIRTKGYGTITIDSKSYTIAQNSLTYYLYVDSDTEDCRASGGQNRNSYLTLNDGVFLTIPPGNSTVLYDNTFTEVKLTPRWWTL